MIFQRAIASAEKHRIKLEPGRENSGGGGGVISSSSSLGVLSPSWMIELLLKLYRSISFWRSDICRSISSKIEASLSLELSPVDERTEEKSDRIDSDLMLSGISPDRKLNNWSKSTPPFSNVELPFMFNPPVDVVTSCSLGLSCPASWDNLAISSAASLKIRKTYKVERRACVHTR